MRLYIIVLGAMFGTSNSMLELSQTLIDAEARAKQLEGQLADTRLEMEKLKGDMAKLQDERDRYRSQVRMWCLRFILFPSVKST